MSPNRRRESRVGWDIFKVWFERTYLVGVSDSVERNGPRIQNSITEERLVIQFDKQQFIGFTGVTTYTSQAG